MDAESYVKPRLHHSVPLPKCSERGGKTEDDDVGSRVKGHRQEFASPPESVRREEVSAKAAAPLASVPAASSYPGRILTRFLLGL